MKITIELDRMNAELLTLQMELMLNQMWHAWPVGRLNNYGNALKSLEEQIENQEKKDE